MLNTDRLAEQRAQNVLHAQPQPDPLPLRNEDPQQRARMTRSAPASQPIHLVKASAHGDFADTLPPRLPHKPLTSTRSCMALGLCQERQPPCEGCTWAEDRRTRRQNVPFFHFAPDTIDGPHQRADLGTRVSRFWEHRGVHLLIAACLAIMLVWCIVLGGLLLGITDVLPKLNPVPRFFNWAAQHLPGWLK